MKNYPELNVDLLDKTLDHIETLEAFRAAGVEMDEHWRQGSWGIQGAGCGTGLCFAGWACRLAGEELVGTGHHGWIRVNGFPVSVHSLEVRNDDSSRTSISEVASKLLGLTLEEQMRLYAGKNDLDDLRDFVAKIKSGGFRGGGDAAA